MGDVLIRTATLEDINCLAANLRPADLEEIKASSTLPPHQALINSLKTSTHVWTGFVDGELTCVMGVGPRCAISQEGTPWMIGTPAIDRHAVTFLRHCRDVLQQMLSAYPYLRNYVDMRNTKSIRWLKWLGFTIQDPVLYGPRKLPFHPFELRR